MYKSVLPYLVLVVIFISFIDSSDGQRYASDGYHYDTKYDYLDIEAILNNKRLVKNYVDCLLNIKPCTPEGKALKRILPEALRTKCARCSPRQKSNAVVILRMLRSRYPEEWQRVAAKWDPTGDLTRSFEKILENDDSNSVGKPPKTTRRPTIARPSTNEGGVVMEEPYKGNMGAPSELKPTVQVYPTYRPIVTSTGYDAFMKTTTYYPELTATTRKPPKSKKPPTQSTTMKMKHKQTTPFSTTYYPDYQPVIFKPIYSGTMDLIDHFGNKIIKTTNLVTGLLKNTVRVVVGGKIE